jgi:hypothetical protein
MREIMIPFASKVNASDGNAYEVRAIGHERADGIWEGVIDFQHDTTRLVTGVETTQANADALEYWATGLSALYLEGALRRARRPLSRRRSQRQERTL